MTPEERVLKTYQFGLPDRVPIDFCACEQIYNLLIEKLMKKYQRYFLKIFSPCMKPPMSMEN